MGTKLYVGNLSFRTTSEELRDAFQAHRLTREQLEGPRFQRIRRVRALQDEGRLDERLRWREPATARA